VVELRHVGRKYLFARTFILWEKKTSKVIYLNIEKLKRRAFRLRRKIDSAKAGKEVIREYVQILWMLYA
jgi:transposase